MANANSKKGSRKKGRGSARSARMETDAPKVQTRYVPPPSRKDAWSTPETIKERLVEADQLDENKMVGGGGQRFRSNQNTGVIKRPKLKVVK